MSSNDDQGFNGAGFDEDPIPFGEAFGINPDGSPYEAETPASEPDSGSSDAPDADVPDVPDVPDAPEDTETASETAARLFGGKYKSVEELEKAHRELTKAWDGRKNEPAPEAEKPEEPRPSPLLKGEHSEIKTESQLFEWAVADPEAAANWVMQNNDMVNQDQMDKVMDNWVSTQPWKAITAISAWNLQIARDEFQEKSQAQEQHFIGQIRDQGIAMAHKDNEMLEQYSEQLGEFIEANPNLNQMVEAARNPEQVAQAINAIFYLMAGPQLKQQALEAQVTRAAAEAAKTRRAEAAAEAAASATTIGRNSAKPPGGEDDYGDAIRAKILNPSGR